MSIKKIQSALNLIEIAQTNLATAKSLLAQLLEEKGGSNITATHSTAPKNPEESEALEVVEGYFDGQNMIGDNGQTYLVPPNYASKTQLVIGDRLKWILTSEREIFKPIQLASRERVMGTFTIEGEDYVVLVDKFPQPIKILKASATYAIKNLGLKPGDEVAITVPKDTTPIWGAFGSVVKSNINHSAPKNVPSETQSMPQELDDLSEFGVSQSAETKPENYNDYF